MRLLIYLLFIGGFAALGFAFSPWLGVFAAAAGWAITATIFWFHDYGTNGASTWALMDRVGGTDLGPTGGICDFSGFDAGFGGGGGD